MRLILRLLGQQLEPRHWCSSHIFLPALHKQRLHLLEGALHLDGVHDVGQHPHDLHTVNRLLQKEGDPALIRLRNHLLAADLREHDIADVRVLLLCLAHKVDSIHNWHQQIHNDNIRVDKAQVLQRIHSIGGTAAHLAQLLLLNNNLENIAHTGIVVNQIKFHLFSTSRFFCGMLMIKSVQPSSDCTRMVPPI